MKQFFYILVFALVFCSMSLSNILLAAENIQVQDIFTYDAKGLRDPFMPLVTSSGVIINLDNEFVIGDLSLEGIMADAKGNNIAIINGNIVKKNDLIGDFVVFDINKDMVVLIKGQQRFELKLQKEE